MPAKPIRISPHARFEMRRRGISRAEVIRMIRRPGQVLPTRKGRHIYQGHIGRLGSLLLRVVVKEDAQAYHVVTAYKTSQVAKFLENAVKVIYDRETDTLSIILRSGKVAESDEPQPGLILDYDKAGRLVSLELLDASEQVQAPHKVEFALAMSEKG